MTVIELPARLIDPLRILAAKQRSSVEAIVEDLVDEYLRQHRHRRLLEEMARYQEQHPKLVGQYQGQFVGMLDGRVLDSDPDGGKLYARLRQQYGDLPILIVEVTEQPEQKFRRLSRRLAP